MIFNQLKCGGNWQYLDKPFWEKEDTKMCTQISLPNTFFTIRNLRFE